MINNDPISTNHPVIVSAAAAVPPAAPKRVYGRKAVFAGDSNFCGYWNSWGPKSVPGLLGGECVAQAGPGIFEVLTQQLRPAANTYIPGADFILRVGTNNFIIGT